MSRNPKCQPNDTSRLNWLIKENCVVWLGSKGFWVCWINDFDYEQSRDQEGAFKTARAAIDAAIAAQAAAKGEHAA